MKSHNFFEVHFTSLDHFRVNLLILITSLSILAVSDGFRKNKKTKMADPR